MVSQKKNAKSQIFLESNLFGQKWWLCIKTNFVLKFFMYMSDRSENCNVNVFGGEISIDDIFKLNQPQEEWPTLQFLIFFFISDNFSVQFLFNLINIIYYEYILGKMNIAQKRQGYATCVLFIFFSFAFFSVRCV